MQGFETRINEQLLFFKCKCKVDVNKPKSRTFCRLLQESALLEFTALVRHTTKQVLIDY